MKDAILNFTPERILVCQLRQIGDVLISTICVELLAKSYPLAEIHFFTEQKCSPMVENNPHIKKIWAVDKKKQAGLWSQFLFYKKVAAEGFDLVVNCQQLPRCTWMALFSGAQYRITTEARWYTRWLYTHSTVPTARYAGAFKAQILSPLGIEWQHQPPRLYLSEDEKATAQNLFTQMGFGDSPVISVDSTHRHATRRWPAAHFAALLDAFGEQYPAVRFFLSYGPGEKHEAEALKAASRYPHKLGIPAEVTGLRTLAACINRCVLHMGNCSAPRHIATALGVPSFTFLGANSPSWTFPAPEHTAIAAGLDCQPCRKTTCPIGIACMTSLTPEQVLPKLVAHFEEFARR